MSHSCLISYFYVCSFISMNSHRPSNSYFYCSWATFVYINTCIYRYRYNIPNLQASALLLPKGRCVSDERDVELGRHRGEGFGEIWSRSFCVHPYFSLATTRTICTCSKQISLKAQWRQHHYCAVAIQAHNHSYLKSVQVISLKNTSNL